MQVRYSAKRPSQVALLSAKNKNLRLQFAPKLGNKRFKIFCLMLKSWLLLHNSNFRQKQHESMAPSYHVHLYIATGYTSSDGCFRQDVKSSDQLKQAFWTWQWFHCTVTRFQFKRAPVGNFLWGRAKQKYLKDLFVTVLSVWSKIPEEFF